MASTITLFSILALTINVSLLAADIQSFINCLSRQTPAHLISQPTSSSFSSVLHSTIRNLRFANPQTRQPVIIITPTQESHIQSSLLCCKNHSLQLRIRSGGHDYEGLSYRSVSNHAFAILDLINLKSISLHENTAWVDSGATLGELYYKIAKNSNAFGFPAGICPSVGVGGHFGGGGFGTLLRKFGLAADNVVDAKLVNVDGEILDRESMGEDLFWALRGGGGGSFGVVISWKINLVPVPSTVSVFNIQKILDQNAIGLIYMWQYKAHKLPEELFIRAVVQKGHQVNEAEAHFSSLFLGSCGELAKLMEERFAELGFERDQCKEMNWIRSVMHFAGLNDGEPLEALLDKSSVPKFFKAKSDYVTDPIPENCWENVWKYFSEESAGILIMEPHGGKMSSIPESDTPYPHREGNLYNLQYFVDWTDNGEDASKKRMDWITRVYNEMGPYVSKHPRASYVSYRDLDLGSNVDEGNVSSYSNAKAWGVKYFKENFERLARIKGRVDPSDFFRNEQSIPPFVEGEMMSTGEVERPRNQAWLAFFLFDMFRWY